MTRATAYVSQSLDYVGLFMKLPSCPGWHQEVAGL